MPVPKPFEPFLSSRTATGVRQPISRATIRPSSRIASGSCSTSAAGAWPLWTSSSSTADAEDEPIVPGRNSTRPAMVSPYSGWRTSAIRPVFGSTPPQKLIGADSTSASPVRHRRRPGFRPELAGGRGGHAASSVNTGLPSDRALDAVGERAVEHGIAGVARRVMREFSGIGHQDAAGLVGQDRRDDDAGVGDDDDAERFQRLAPAGPVEFGDDMAAGAGMDRNAEPPPGDQPLQRVELGERQMRAADRHRVDASRLARRSRAAPARRPPFPCVTRMTVFGAMPPSAVSSVRRFRRDAGDVEQADRSRRRSSRAERLQRILARMFARCR